MPDINISPSAGGAQPPSRKKMYKNCDRCRQAKRACSAQYVSIAEALASKVACNNCKKKGQVCTFNSLINSFGGIPLGGLTGAAFAESLQDVANAAPSTSTADVEQYAEGASTSYTTDKRRRHSLQDGFDESHLSAISNVNAAFEALNGSYSNDQSDEEQRAAKRKKDSSDATSSAFETFDEVAQPTASTSYSTGSLVLSRAQSPFGFDQSDAPSLFDMLGFDIWGTAPNVRLSHTADRLHLNSDLLNVYEGAAESAFRIWVTDATTPYLLCADSLSPSSAAMALNKKVCLLDSASRRIFRTDDAARNVEKRVSEAYHAVLLAYAAQWPRHTGERGGRQEEARVRLSLWKQARDKLMDATDAWSFRIVFALILFAWTEKPREMPSSEAWDHGTQPASLQIPSLDENSALDSSSWQIPAEASTMMLATAMRKLKAFRLKIQQLRRKGIDLWSTTEPLDAGQAVKRQAEATLLENTYHNLYWFGCMMDTELSVLRKYDAVIGDEDSDLTDQLLSPHRASSLRHETANFPTTASSGSSRKPLRKIWDEVIPANSVANRHTFARSWPCSEPDALRTLAYATPIKVLIFRHVGRLQSSYWRQAPTEHIERQIAHVLSVVRHWDETFAPFFASCITHHADLPTSIQSWHVITATKWNLAAILLVELVSTMERTDPFGATEAVLSELRRKVCHQTAELIGAIQACSETGGDILHSDPWPEISIHGFACVAKSEIKQLSSLAKGGEWDEVRRVEERVEKCLWALEQLSNRSSMAVDAKEEVGRLLDAHSPLRQGAPGTGATQGEGMAAVMTEDVWQSCLEILNEGASAAESDGWTGGAGIEEELFLSSLNKTSESFTDESSSRASSNHSLSPPLTTLTLASLDYPSAMLDQPQGRAKRDDASGVGDFQFGMGLTAGDALDGFLLRV
uniref:Zn(2)-C6 fungal-type domain-containing protein n=2 Tax=Kalmanozyma brasiliensis (strain GHG001) TaxID=1365824 RepID=V5EVT0_KALBG